MKRKFLVFLLLFLVINLSFAQEQTEVEPELKDAIEELLILTGAEEQAKKMFHLVIEQAVPASRDDYELLQYLKEQVDLSELIELLVPIYAKYYTLEDVRGLIEFYKTPLGQKLLSKQSMIMQDSYFAGQKWGQSLSTELRKYHQEYKAKQNSVNEESEE